MSFFTDFLYYLTWLALALHAVLMLTGIGIIALAMAALVSGWRPRPQRLLALFVFAVASFYIGVLLLVFA